MTKTDSVRARVKDYLEMKAPLSLFTLDDLYPIFTPEQSNSVRAALYGLSVNTPVSERNCPSKYYAIRLKLGDNEVFLSLPGVPSEDLKKDLLSKNRTEEKIAGLQKKYGKETIDYWVQSAQHRSVVLAASGMRAAKKRDDKTCLLCGLEGNNNMRSVSACHIISRKTLFWEALDEVERLKGNIFTDDAVNLLKTKIKDDDRHSGLEFIVTLCLEHDNLLKDALLDSMTRTQCNKKNTMSPLFDATEVH